MLRQHRLIATLLSASGDFQAGRIGLEQLQKRFSAVMSALENDVPRVVHDAVRRTEADLESAAFYDVDVASVLRRFADVVDAQDRGDGVGSSG